MSVKPRKVAKQPRSRITVDAIVEAAARVVSQVGLDRANTNRIAEVAGVSIGSLYQYFPGKTALLAAVIEREAEADAEAMEAIFEQCRALTMPEAIDHAITRFVARIGRNPALYRWMLTYVPSLGQHPKVRALAARSRASFREFLESRRAELAAHVEPGLAAMLLGSAVEAAVQTAVFERPEAVTDGTLARELTRMCGRYLLE